MSDLAVMIIAIVMSLVSLMLFIKLHRVRTHAQSVIDSPLIPKAVEEAQDRIDIQTGKLRHNLRRIAQSHSPIDELVKALSKEEEDGNGNGSDGGRANR